MPRSMQVLQLVLSETPKPCNTRSAACPTTHEHQGQCATIHQHWCNPRSATKSQIKWVQPYHHAVVQVWSDATARRVQESPDAPQAAAANSDRPYQTRTARQRRDEIWDERRCCTQHRQQTSARTPAGQQTRQNLTTDTDTACRVVAAPHSMQGATVAASPAAD